METPKKLPPFRVGRRILFTDDRYGPSLGIITTITIPKTEKRGYVAVCKPAHFYTDDDWKSFYTGDNDDPYAVPCEQIKPETVDAIWEEPFIAAVAFRFDSFGNCLYARKPKPKKMTVSEICEALGYEVEIVKEREA